MHSDVILSLSATDIYIACAYGFAFIALGLLSLHTWLKGRKK